VASPQGGSVLTLDGRNSVAGTGRTIAAYQWRQVSGPPVNIENATSAVATVQLPGEGATFVFELVVTDSAGASDAETVTITSTSAPGGGGGGGAMSLAWGLGLWALALLALRRR
jgi:serine protease